MPILLPPNKPISYNAELEMPIVQKETAYEELGQNRFYRFYVDIHTVHCANMATTQ